MATAETMGCATTICTDKTGAHALKHRTLNRYHTICAAEAMVCATTICTDKAPQHTLKCMRV